MKDLLLLFLFYIEEAGAAIFLGLSLLAIRPGWKKIAAMGISYGIFVYLVRTLYGILSIPLGTHMIFTISAFFIINKIFTGARWGISVAAGMLSFLFIALSEIIVWPVVMDLFNVTYQEVVKNPILHLKIAYLGDSLMFLTALIVGLTGFSMVRGRQNQ